MNVDQPSTDHLSRHHEHPAAAGEPTHLTSGIVSLVLGLLALMGGGTPGTAMQLWTIKAISRPYEEVPGVFSIYQGISNLPVIVLGVVAICLGLVAVRSGHAVTSAIGKAGATTGALSLVGGVLLIVVMESAPY